MDRLRTERHPGVWDNGGMESDGVKKLRCGLRRSRRVGGGLWQSGEKKRKTRPDIARRRERQRDWERCYRTRKERRILRSDTHWPSRRVEGILVRHARRTETCVSPTCVALRHDVTCRCVA